MKRCHPFQIYVLLILIIALSGCGGSSGTNPGGDNPGTTPGGGSPGKSLNDRLAAHQFPKLANQYQLASVNGNQQLFQDLPYWDLAVVDAEMVYYNKEYLGSNGFLRNQNPNLVILTYFSAADIGETNPNPITSNFNKGLDASWYMHDTTGKKINLFEIAPGTYTFLQNHLTPINMYLPKYMKEKILDTNLVDGIYYDWAANTSITFLNGQYGNGTIDINNDHVADSEAAINDGFVQGMKQMLENSRSIFPAGTPIMGNAGWNSDPKYESQLNGIMIEQFLQGDTPNPSFGWSAIMYTYGYYTINGVQPRLSYIMANGTQTNYQFMRYAMASTLMFDGYFCYTNSSGAYSQAWWYDEYALDINDGRSQKDLRYKGYLGQALSDAYNVNSKTEKLFSILQSDYFSKTTQAETKVWRRDFKNGIVLVNPTSSAQTINLGGTFRKIKGTIDPIFNDGTQVNTIVLPSKSGAILLN